MKYVTIVEKAIQEISHFSACTMDVRANKKINTVYLNLPSDNGLPKKFPKFFILG